MPSTTTTTAYYNDNDDYWTCKKVKSYQTFQKKILYKATPTPVITWPFQPVNLSINLGLSICRRTRHVIIDHVIVILITGNRSTDWHTKDMSECRDEYWRHRPRLTVILATAVFVLLWMYNRWVYIKLILSYFSTKIVTVYIFEINLIV